ncbi:hypothetical protein HMPREF1981_01258 [Bacteroides pyogenes F0041]|uniref:Uncharacterized protein n=1 Tax=Bacteroides pyogenes F0041 TaxID=1321819 RepID=U2CPA7_9BACE|nr:hypothetical protein HMPREF1981_01258 [Bacteroides pyogenes F0041]
MCKHASPMKTLKGWHDFQTSDSMCKHANPMKERKPCPKANAAGIARMKG